MKSASVVVFVSLLCAVAAHRGGHRRPSSSSVEQAPPYVLDFSPGFHPQDCSYVNEDSTLRFDLGPLALNGNESYHFQDEKGNLWDFNVCSPLHDSGCDSTAAVCKNNAANAGRAESVQWSKLADDNGVEMVVGGGDECGEGKTMKTSLTFLCNYTQDTKLELVSITSLDACYSQLVFSSASACAGPIGIVEAWDETDYSSSVFTFVCMIAAMSICCCCCVRLTRRHKKAKETIEFSDMTFHQAPAYTAQLPFMPAPQPMHGQHAFLVAPQWYPTHPMQQVHQPMQLINEVEMSNDEQFARMLQEKFNAEGV